MSIRKFFANAFAWRTATGFSKGGLVGSDPMPFQSENGPHLVFGSAENKARVREVLSAIATEQNDRSDSEYRQHPRDLRLKRDLFEQRKSLVEEEMELVAEINDRLVKLQSTRKAVRAIDAAGQIIVTEEKAYPPMIMAYGEKRKNDVHSAADHIERLNRNTTTSVQEARIDDESMSALAQEFIDGKPSERQEQAFLKDKA